MRGRGLAAAAAMLAGTGCFVAPVWGQSADAQSSAPPAVADTIRLGAVPVGSGDFSLFANRAEWGLGSTAFSSQGESFAISGHYARVPALDLVAAPRAADEVIVLRDFQASAKLAQGFELNFAGWRFPLGSGFWESQVSGAFGNPILAAASVRSPYAGLGAAGSYIGARVSLTDSLSAHVGQASSSLGLAPDVAAPLPPDLAFRLSGGPHTIETTALGLDWNVTDWAGVGVTASQTHETGSLLGAAMNGTIASTAGAETAALGVSARIGFGEGWVTSVAYNEGVTQLNLNGNSFAGFDPLRTQTYGIAVAKQGLFGDDALGFSVSRPLQVYSSTDVAGIPMASVTGRPPAATTAQQSDFELGYVTTFLDGALALQANAAYQFNANGDKGQDAVSVLSRAKIRF